MLAVCPSVSLCNSVFAVPVRRDIKHSLAAASLLDLADPGACTLGGATLAAALVTANKGLFLANMGDSLCVIYLSLPPCPSPF